MSGTAFAARTVRLLADGCLVLESDAAHEEAVARWLPLTAAPGSAARDAATIAVHAARREIEPPPRPADLRLGSASAWLEGDTALLRATGGTTARVALVDRTAALWVPDERAAWTDLTGALNVCAALLLGRLGRALAHAGCVVAPDGRAWLVIGDTHAGKTTTCASLVEAGGAYVSDDTVVLGRATDGTSVAEGWPRLMHLDPGWSAGRPSGAREAVSALERWPDRIRRQASPQGILLPRVEAGAATAGTRAAAADAFAALVRQSPWLVMDRGAGRTAMQLLRAVALLPAWRLSLGLDSYGRPAALADVVAALSS